MTICKPCYGNKCAVRPYNIGKVIFGSEGKEADHKDDMEELSDEDVQRGARRVQRMNNPKSPTFEERIEHEYLHLPYRSWCTHCVMGERKGSTSSTSR
jgi:hypothetical protein